MLDAHRSRVEAALGRPVRPDEPVFTFRGRRIQYEYARRQLLRLVGLAGIEGAGYGWHSFRQGGATLHADAAVSPLTLQQLMRDTDFGATLKYVRRGVHGGREAAEAAAKRVHQGE